MILPREEMIKRPCIGHEGLGRRDETGARLCIAEECLGYKIATTYLGDIADHRREGESMDALWDRRQLGGCQFARHTNEEYARRDAGQGYAD